MALSEEGGTGTVMPVMPMGNNGGADGFGFGGGWWFLILFFLLCGGGFGGNFGGGMNNMWPWMNQSNQIASGFADSALNNSINGINSTLNANAMTALERSFAEQTATTNGFFNLQSQLSQCCCDNRLATCQTQNLVQSEGAATRLAIQQQTQAILDKMCQQEIDALKEKNLELQNRVNMQALVASQTAQTAQLIADNTAQTQYIVNRVAPYPIPSYTVTNPATPAA